MRKRFAGSDNFAGRTHMRKLPVLLILSVFSAMQLLHICGCGTEPEEWGDITELFGRVYMTDSSGAYVNTVSGMDELELTLEVVNGSEDKISLEYDHCTPALFQVLRHNASIWISPEADCIDMREETVRPGGMLVFHESWRQAEWNYAAQEWVPLADGEYELRAVFRCLSRDDDDKIYTIDVSFTFVVRN